MLTRITLPTLSMLLALVCSAPTLHAQVVDDCDDTDHFKSNFGGATAVPVDGGVLITRTQADADAGVDWSGPDGAALPLNDEHDRLTLTPAEARDGGYLVASILFFDSRGEFVEEQLWLTDTNDPRERVLASVSGLADKHQIDATGYKLRLRINPVEKTGAAFLIDRIAATAAEAE